mgnify:CR=1 FL=1
MRLERINMENEFILDMITNNGFIIKNEDQYAPINVDNLINSSKFMDNEYRCDCGAFMGQDILGRVCPKCNTEISLHSLNFKYTGWIDIAPHHVITPIYYNMLSRVLTPNMLKYILGDYKTDFSVPYNENDTNFYENKKKRKTGRIVQEDLAYIKKKIPKSKQCYEGLGHDEFYKRFEEVLTTCASKNVEDVDILLKERDAVFTSKIPVYSTAFRPVSKTSETMFYPKINKPFSQMVAIQCKLPDMTLSIEVIQALNFVQKYWMEATDHLIKNEISKKEGFVRSEIVGGTFSFSFRSVITLDISLNIDEVDLPLTTCIRGFQFKIAHILATRYNMTLEQAYLYVQGYKHNPLVIEILDEIMAEGQWVYILREPTINIASIELCKIRRYKVGDDTISLPPETLSGYNADFDGDALNGAFLGSMKDGIVQQFESFHYSCMMNYVTNKVDIDLLNWCDICLGLMSE